MPSVLARCSRLALAIAWELPQSSLGLANLVLEVVRRGVARVTYEHDRVFVELRASRAISLGHFVFWSTVDSAFVRVTPHNKAHEYGHARQSRMLGPLYLLVVGLPSSMRVAYAVAQYAITKRPWEGYYDGFPESWADRLGGVPPRPTRSWRRAPRRR